MYSIQEFKEDILWHRLVILMMSFYLLADMMAGFTVIYLGVDLKVSLIYKMPIFFLLLFLIGRNNIKTMLLLISAILFFFIGPFYQFTQHVRLDFFFVDFSLTIKLITSLVVFIYFKNLFNTNLKFAIKSVERILWISFLILFLNFILGGLGLGKSTYKLVGDEGAGSTGLILAGNELGAAFLVTFGFALHKAWNESNRFIYLLLCFLTILFGVSVSTKTTMLASLLLVFFIPIVNEKESLYKVTKLKIILLLPLISLITLIIYLIFDILEKIGLYDRVMWFYQQKGLMGIILSGRDTMASDRVDIVLNNSNLFEQLFGQGVALGLKDKKGLAGVEIDSIDVFNLYGIFTLIFLSSFYIFGVYKAHQQTISGESSIAPFVFLVSFLLLCLSQLSGHIWTSGTLGILLGIMLSLLYAPKTFETRIYK